MLAFCQALQATVARAPWVAREIAKVLGELAGRPDIRGKMESLPLGQCAQEVWLGLDKQGVQPNLKVVEHMSSEDAVLLGFLRASLGVGIAYKKLVQHRQSVC